MIDRTEEEIMRNWQGDPSKPVVSICCITYNHEKFIEEALDSFLMQETDFPFEIVIDDDASPDRTSEIIEQYIEKYPNIMNARLRDKNVGSMTNFIENMKRGQGKYIALCEGDDYWTDPLKLQKQVDILEKNNKISGVHHKVIYVDSNNIKLGESNRVEKGFELVDYKYLGQRNTIHTCSFIFRNNIMDTDFYDLIQKAPVGDLPIFLKASANGKIAYIDSSMGAYRQNVGVSGKWEKEYSIKNVIDVYYILYNIPNLRKVFRISKRYYYYKLACNASSENEYFNSLNYYLHCLFYTIFVFNTDIHIVNSVSIRKYLKCALFQIPFFNHFYYKHIKKIIS